MQLLKFPSRGENNELAQKYEAINKSMAVIEFLPDGTILEANENFLGAMGYSLEEIAGQHHSMFAPPGLADSAEYKEFWDILRSGKFHTGEYLRKGKGGADVWIQASYNPIIDKNGNVVKVIKFASDITAQKLQQKEHLEKADRQSKAVEIFETRISGISETLGGSANSLQEMAATLSAAVQETSQQGHAVASSSDLASQNVQNVATAAEEISLSIQEISQNVSDTADTAKLCAQSAHVSQDKLKDLQSAVDEIDSVIQSINEVAEQTNLLALNATIEAARAGEAGKGFAVVASEVKSLANETHKMTDEISRKVGDIKASASETIASVNDIIGQITSVDEKTASVASAIKEQDASTSEISRNIQQAAAGTNEVSLNITEVQKAADESAQSTDQVKLSADDLNQQAQELKSAVDGFLKDLNH